MRLPLIKSTHIKAVTDLEVGGGVAEALNALIHEIIKKAEARAKANNRRTLMVRDL